MLANGHVLLVAACLTASILSTTHRWMQHAANLCMLASAGRRW
jgi:hypothetical protein